MFRNNVLTFLACLTTIGAASIATADVGLKYSLRSDMQENWAIRTEYDNGVDCYPLGKGDEVNALGSETTSAQFSEEQNAAGSYSLVTYTSKYQRLGLRNTMLKLKETPIANSGATLVDFTIDDGINVNPRSHYRGGTCSDQYLIGNVTKFALTGEIAVRYKMPKGVWLVQVTPRSITQVMVTALADEVTDALTRTTINHKGEFYVWGKPGQYINFNLKLPNQPGIMGNYGNLQFEMRPVGDDAATTDKISDIFKSLLRRDDIVSGAKADGGATLLNNLGTLIRSQDALKKVINDIGTSKFEQIAHNLFGFANTDLNFGPTDLHLKAMAAIASYNMAIDLLTDLKSFCTNVELTMPFSRKTENYSGFAVAYYWLHRSEMRLSGYNYADIEEVLAEQVRFENDRLTFGTVANDKGAFEKIRTAYRYILQFGELGADPYTDFGIDISRTSKQFGSIGVGAGTTQDILNGLAKLSERHRQLMGRIADFFHSYKTNNLEPIQVTPLLAELKNIKSERDRLVDIVQSQVKFLSAGQTADGSSGDLVDDIAALLVHEVNIFEEPLTSKFIEPIRSAYKSQQNIDDLKTIYNQCLFGVN